MSTNLKLYILVAINNEEAVHHAVSFAAANTFIGLPQMKAYTSINIRYQIRTFESNGLLMYNAGKFQIECDILVQDINFVNE